MTARQLGASYHFAVAVLRPPLMALTKRDWRGAEHLPREGGFVAVTNHISHVDPLTFGHFLYDNGAPPRYLAKESMFRIPLAGRIVAGAGQIPVYRETMDAARALAAAVRAVEEGECVGIYPESTLTRDPGLWPMAGKTGAARVALTTGCPVIPVAQWGAQEILAPYGKRPHLLPRKTIHVHAGPPVDLSAYAGRPLDAPTLRAATEDIMAAITVLLEGIRGGKAPSVRWDPRQHDLPRTGNPNRRNGGKERA
ncbi:MAG TPA: lysophospholipid acyltransferase family protein [Kineosporiaceae bacterium]|nr:lysophospholipid acyltransferase family protein [Kineosporiaceae bacterium]